MGRKGCLEMLEGWGIQLKARQENAFTEKCAKISLADLVQPIENLHSLADVVEFEIGFCPKVQAARAIGMLLNFNLQFIEVGLAPLLCRKASAALNIIKNILPRLGSGPRVFVPRAHEL